MAYIAYICEGLFGLNRRSMMKIAIQYIWI